MSGECQVCNEHCVDCECMGHDLNINFQEIYDELAMLRPHAHDPVNHPSHYQGKKFEVIDIIEDFDLDFCLGNAIKYILRSEKKEDPIMDLNKAIWYLERKCKAYEQKKVPAEDNQWC